MCQPDGSLVSGAAVRGGPVQFLCICVESVRVAQNFERMFGFSKVTNGFIPDNASMPRGFGQLGCSGFVVVDGHGNFISKRTAAFLEEGEGAFRDVETILAAHLERLAPPPGQQPGGAASGEQGGNNKNERLHAEYPYAVGSVALRDGLKTAGLNGKRSPFWSSRRRRGASPWSLSEGPDGEVPRRLAILPQPGAAVVIAASSSSPRRRWRAPPNRAAAAATRRQEPIEAIAAPPSVGVEVWTTNTNARTPSTHFSPRVSLGKEGAPPVLLQRVLDELEDHFAHEELLMKDYRFGGSDQNGASSFSAFSSHVKDHERILDIARGELARLKAEAVTKGEEAFAAPAVAQAIAHGFHTHAERFDALYAEHIPQSAV